MFYRPLGPAIVGLLLGSCAFFEPAAAVLWTDRPEFAFYGEYFNSSQDLYKIEIHCFPSPAEKLTNTGEYPDIVAGSWLKSASTRNLFRPLDYLFKDGLIAEQSFYPRLLSLGRIEGKQYLLPVSFNLPALVFAPENGFLLSNSFTIAPEEIKKISQEFNTIEGNGFFSRMGFSPAWNDEFLFVMATLFDASFREASPVAWNPQALEAVIAYIRAWITEANTGIEAVDDFVFKYFYDPPAKLVISARIFFTYMKSSEFFTLAPEQRANLNFRWIAENDTIPLSEETVYYGIYRKGRAKKAATAFTEWFFREETQRLFLEMSKKNRMNETHFGIGGGFSAMQTVTEQIFPQFYPGLLGHIPPEAFLSPPNILPQNWMTLKERVVLPYLRDRIRHDSPQEMRSLEKQISEWVRINRSF
jgi:hypothetical protein